MKWRLKPKNILNRHETLTALANASNSVVLYVKVELQHELRGETGWPGVEIPEQCVVDGFAVVLFPDRMKAVEEMKKVKSGTYAAVFDADGLYDENT